MINPRSKRGRVIAVTAGLTIGAAVFAIAPCPADTNEQAAALGILSPTVGAPVVVGDADILEARIQLRLPLTPPPGVQNPAAVAGWTVTLERHDLITPTGERTRAAYTFPIMRLRPVDAEDVYRITVELVPWLPAGRYDLAITGPGFRAIAPGAVWFDAPPRAIPSAVEIVPQETGFAVLNKTSRKRSHTLLLALTKKTSGVHLFVDGKRQRPDSASFSSIENNHPGAGRVLSFSLVLPPTTEGGTSGRRDVRVVPIDATPCGGTIVWPDTEKVAGAIAWRNLRWSSDTSSDPPPVAVIWDFGDRRWGIGRSVRHRWLLQNEVAVNGFAIDEFGRTCHATSRYQLNTLKSGRGCSCTAIGR